MRKIGVEYTARNEQSQASNDRLLEIHSELLPRFGANWHRHSLVGMRVEALARVLYYSHLYTKIITVPGVICEFGVQWGATLTNLINLRSIYEPFNHSRHIFGFDTFEGFPEIAKEDGEFTSIGDYSSITRYETQLQELLSLHEQVAPMNHIQKFTLVKGDVNETFDAWLESNPHAIISMAIFDMDLYKPTKKVLESVIPRLTKGSLLVFDEVNCPVFPGETVALRETLGTHNLRLQRLPYQPFCSWAEW